MSEINTAICARCGYPADEHRSGDAMCPVYNRGGKLLGWTGGYSTKVREEKLFTAADLKEARLETVERCLYLLDLYISNVGPLAAKKAIEMFKEEIENEV